MMNTSDVEADCNIDVMPTVVSELGTFLVEVDVIGDEPVLVNKVEALLVEVFIDELGRLVVEVDNLISKLYTCVGEVMRNALDELD